MSATDIFFMERVMRFAWTEPKSLAEQDYQINFWTPRRQEPIDFDWWEPTSEWRRENARWVEKFGGEKFGKPSPPVEGPNNPERLRRELLQTEANEREALSRREEAEAEIAAASTRINALELRLVGGRQ